MTDKIGLGPAYPHMGIGGSINDLGSDILSPGVSVRQLACLMAMQMIPQIFDVQKMAAFPEREQDICADAVINFADAVLKRERETRG